MNNKRILEELIFKIKEYAEGRASDVANGLETPRFAALLLQKYAYGIADAVRVLQVNGLEVDTSLYSVVDEEVAKIDPKWREHMHERWASRPADISFNIPNK